MIDESTVMTFQAKNGRSIHLRSIQNGDAPLLVSIFEHMSSDSRYQRFHQTLDNPNPRRVWQEAEQMVAIVPKSSFGFIAFAGDVPVGAARYIIFEEGKAETAVSIVDDYQNSGIGTQLVTLLAHEAKKRGVQQLVASAQVQNKAALRVLEKLPFPHTQRVEDSVVEVVIDLTAELTTS
jgi:RimJ/RimL family protein N-acetyltransferase